MNDNEDLDNWSQDDSQSIKANSDDSDVNNESENNNDDDNDHSSPENEQISLDKPKKDQNKNKNWTTFDTVYNYNNDLGKKNYLYCPKTNKMYEILSKKPKNNALVIKEKGSETNESKTITQEEINEYRVTRNINILYIDYNFRTIQLKYPFKINGSYQCFYNNFIAIYHIRDSSANIFYKNKMIEKSQYDEFCKDFDYDKDYLIVTEKQNEVISQMNCNTFSHYIYDDNVIEEEFILIVNSNVQLCVLTISSKTEMTMSVDIYKLQIPYDKDINRREESKKREQLKTKVFNTNWKDKSEHMYSVTGIQGIVSFDDNSYTDVCKCYFNKIVLLSCKNIYVFKVKMGRKVITDVVSVNMVKESVNDSLIKINSCDQTIINGLSTRHVSDLAFIN